MHILIEYSTIKIPTEKYGGIERIIWDLCKTLVQLKHKVTYLVAKGSYCSFAKVIEYNPSVSLDKQVPENVNIVHNHSFTTESIKKPMLFIMHGNHLTKAALHINTVFLSKNHAKRHNSNTYIYNGLDWVNYPKIKT